MPRRTQESAAFFLYSGRQPIIWDPWLPTTLLARAARFSYSCGMPHNTSQPDSGSPEEGQRAVPITSRFLFVDVAAQRAKQLRRGAQPPSDIPRTSSSASRWKKFASALSNTRCRFAPTVAASPLPEAVRATARNGNFAQPFA